MNGSGAESTKPREGSGIACPPTNSATRGLIARSAPNGHDQDLNWWSKQAWPSTFQRTGLGDLSTFLTNWDWLSVDECGAIGDRVGSTVDASGVYTSGPFKTLRAHCNYLLNGCWGFYHANQQFGLTSGFTVDKVWNDLMAARDAHKTISFVPMMWEGGVWDPATLSLLQQIGQRYDSLCGTRCIEINNTDPSITYAGTTRSRTWSTSADWRTGSTP